MFFNREVQEIMSRRLIDSTISAAISIEIEKKDVFVSYVLLVKALRQAERDIEQAIKKSKNGISVGKVAGFLVYWISQLHVVSVSDEILDTQESSERLPCLAAVIFGIEVFVRHHPPPAILANMVYMLYTGKFTPETLGILFDTIVLMGDAKVGEPINEKMR